MLHFALCVICEHCVFGQVRVSFELLNRPFWSNLDPKPCCEELLGCSRDLWGEASNFWASGVDLEAALGIVFRTLVSM